MLKRYCAALVLALFAQSALSVELAIDIAGGALQECSQDGGTTVQFTVAPIPSPDQLKGEPSWGIGPEIRSDQMSAQTVTVGFTGVLGRVEVYTQPAWSPTEDLVVSIFSVSSDVPDQELATVNVASSEVGRNSRDYTVVDFSFANLSFSAGDKFAIVLRTQQSLPSYYIWWGNYDAEELYDGGTAFRSFDGGVTWAETGNAEFDFFFWTYMVPANDVLAAIEWQIDGSTQGYDNPLSTLVPLGAHSVQAIATTVSGESTEATRPLTIVDTTAPSLSLSVVDSDGNPVSEIRPKGLNKVTAVYEATDVCDPAPIVSALAGTQVVSGQEMKIHSSTGEVILEADTFAVTAIATDQSGNSEREEILFSLGQ